jgi:hypothetical protein
MSKIDAAMVAITRKIAESGIGKTRKNQQQGYNFRGVDEVMNAFAPILASEGVFVRPHFANRSVDVRQTAKGGVLFSVAVEGSFAFRADDGSEVQVGPFFGEAMDSGDKATNKAMAVAFKYAMFQTFCVPLEGVTGGDADGQTHEAIADVVSPEQRSQLANWIADTDSNEDAFCAYFGAESLERFPKTRFDEALAKLKSKKKIAA